MQIIRCKREMPQMEVAPQCTQKLYVGRKADWVLKFSCFFGFQESRGIGYSRYCVFKNFSRILEKFHFSISISKHFQFTFHSRFQGILISFSKRVNHIFMSLFTSRKELIIFSFHFSLLGKSERDFFFCNFSLLKLSISTLAGHCICPTGTGTWQEESVKQLTAEQSLLSLIELCS